MDDALRQKIRDLLAATQVYVDAVESMRATVAPFLPAATSAANKGERGDEVVQSRDVLRHAFGRTAIALAALRRAWREVERELQA